MTILEEEITEEEVRAQQQELADRVGCSIAEVYQRMDAGEFHGTILASKLSMLRFLLGED
jgi:DNA-binding Lrp family transcriptional regulator